jgi:phosphatidylglycerophosphate synthase
MPLTALLTPPPELPLTSPLQVGGRSVLVRHARLAEVAGIKRVLVLGEAGPPGVQPVRRVADLGAMIADDDLVLMLFPGVIVDERIVAAVCALGAPVIATWPAVGAGKHAGVERIDALTIAAGVALYSGAMIRRIAVSLDDWDLHATLLRAGLAEPGMQRLDLTALDTYAPARRRRVPLVWALPQSPADAEAATTMLIKASQKGCLDWPARFIHPVIEDLLVRLVAPTAITPNMVTVFVTLLAVAAGVAFACGWLWTGLVIVLISGPLDGVDGKLARLRLEYSRWGDVEHILDKAGEYGWYACLAAHFAATRSPDGPWAVAALIVLFALAESLAGEFFRRFTGRQLDDAGEFERRFRLVSGRRNTFFWFLLPFGVGGAWYAGFIGIAVYAVATFAVMQLRFYRRLATFGQQNSARIAGNFAATTYDFLPGAKG